jgi:thymidylate synthase
MNNFLSRSPSEAYLSALRDVWENPDYISSPRGQKVFEKFNYVFTISHPDTNPIVTKDEERNKVIAEYSKKEFELYDSMTNKVEDFSKASKFWSKLANPDGTVNSAYGYLIFKNKSHGNNFEKELVTTSPARFPGDGSISETRSVRRTPWEWCVESLKADKDTRQAILRFSLPEHFWIGNRDMVCTLHGFFSIRHDRLDFTVNMRSNDLTLGLVYDLPWFISLMDRMINELKETYPNLQMGKYTHFVHNLHIYERDFDKVRKMLGVP